MLVRPSWMQDKRLKQTLSQKLDQPRSLKQAVLGTTVPLSRQRSLRARPLMTSQMQRLRPSWKVLGQSTIQLRSMEQQRHWILQAQTSLKRLERMRLIPQQQC